MRLIRWTTAAVLFALGGTLMVRGAADKIDKSRLLVGQAAFAL